MTAQTIRIGTRGSNLAQIQTNLIAQSLTKLHPELNIEIVIIKTAGDTFPGPIPERVVGKAWFTAEIENALLEKQIDLAVHSLKDMPIEINERLLLTSALKRDDPRDVLISADGKTLAQLSPGSVIGTDSRRRQVQVLASRPDLVVKSIRGNVDTRLRKLREENYDAIVIAAAGIARLGRISEVTEFFDPLKYVPAVGQGALAVEIRRDDSQLAKYLNDIQDQQTNQAVMAERQFSLTIGGGCKLPIGCYGKITGTSIQLYGMIASGDGKIILKDSIAGSTSQSLDLAKNLARKILKKCDFSLQLDIMTETG